MKKREKEFCKELAEFLCYPSAFEIGGPENKLRDIIKCITIGNPIFFRQVMDFCKEMVSDGDYDAYAYEFAEEKEVLKMMADDYYSIFYK